MSKLLAVSVGRVISQLSETVKLCEFASGINRRYNVAVTRSFSISSITRVTYMRDDARLYPKTRAARTARTALRTN